MKNTLLDSSSLTLPSSKKNNNINYVIGFLLLVAVGVVIWAIVVQVNRKKKNNSNAAVGVLNPIVPAVPGTATASATTTTPTPSNIPTKPISPTVLSTTALAGVGLPGIFVSSGNISPTSNNSSLNSSTTTTTSSPVSSNSTSQNSSLPSASGSNAASSKNSGVAPPVDTVSNSSTTIPSSTGTGKTGTEGKNGGGGAKNSAKNSTKNSSSSNSVPSTTTTNIAATTTQNSTTTSTTTVPKTGVSFGNELGLPMFLGNTAQTTTLITAKDETECRQKIGAWDPDALTCSAVSEIAKIQACLYADPVNNIATSAGECWTAKDRKRMSQLGPGQPSAIFDSIYLQDPSMLGPGGTGRSAVEAFGYLDTAKPGDLQRKLESRILYTLNSSNLQKVAPCPPETSGVNCACPAPSALLKNQICDDATGVARYSCINGFTGKNCLCNPLDTGKNQICDDSTGVALFSCKPGFYGQNCVCPEWSRDNPNVAYCDGKTGLVKCKPGYSGARCEVPPSNCPADFVKTNKSKFLSCDPVSGVISCTNLPAHASTCDVKTGLPICDPSYTYNPNSQTCFETCPAVMPSQFVACDPLTGLLSCQKLPPFSRSCDTVTGLVQCAPGYNFSKDANSTCVKDCPANLPDTVTCDPTGLLSCVPLQNAKGCNLDPSSTTFGQVLCLPSYNYNPDSKSCVPDCPLVLPDTVTCDPKTGSLSCVPKPNAKGCDLNPLSATFGQVQCVAGYNYNSTKKDCVKDCPTIVPDTVACESSSGLLSCVPKSFASGCDLDPASKFFGQVQCLPGYNYSSTKNDCVKDCPFTVPDTVVCDPSTGALSCVAKPFSVGCNLDPLSASFGKVYCETNYNYNATTKECVKNCPAVVPDTVVCDPLTGGLSCAPKSFAQGCNLDPTSKDFGLVQCLPGYNYNTTKKDCVKDCPSNIPDTVVCDPLTGGLSCVPKLFSSGCDLDPQSSTFGAVTCVPNYNYNATSKICVKDCPSLVPDTVVCDPSTGLLSCVAKPFAKGCNLDPLSAQFGEVQCVSGYSYNTQLKQCIKDCPASVPDTVVCDPLTGGLSCATKPFASGCDLDPLSTSFGLVYCQSGYNYNATSKTCVKDCPLVTPDTVVCDPLTGNLSCVPKANSQGCNLDPASAQFGQVTCIPGYKYNGNECIKECPGTFPESIMCDASTGLLSCVTKANSTGCDADPNSATFGKVFCETGYNYNGSSCVKDCPAPLPGTVLCDITTGSLACTTVKNAAGCELNPASQDFGKVLCIPGFNYNGTDCVKDCPLPLPDSVLCDAKSGTLSCASKANSTGCDLDRLSATFGQVFCATGYNYNGTDCVKNCPLPLPDTVLCVEKSGVLTCKPKSNNAKGCDLDPASATFGKVFCDTGFNYNGTDCVKDCPVPLPASILCDSFSGSLSCAPKANSTGCDADRLSATFGKVFCDTGYNYNGTDCVKDCPMPLPDSVLCNEFTGSLSCKSKANSTGCDFDRLSPTFGKVFCDTGFNYNGTDCVKDCPVPLPASVLCDSFSGTLSCAPKTNATGCDLDRLSATFGKVFCATGYNYNGTECVKNCPLPLPDTVSCNDKSGVLTCKPKSNNAKGCDLDPASATFGKVLCDTGFNYNGTDCVKDCPNPLPDSVSCDAPSGTLKCVAKLNATGCDLDPLSATFGQVFCEPKYNYNITDQKCVKDCPTPLPDTVLCDASTGILKCVTKSNNSMGCDLDPASATFGKVLCDAGFNYNGTDCVKDCPVIVPQVAVEGIAAVGGLSSGFGVQTRSSSVLDAFEPYDLTALDKDNFNFASGGVSVNGVTFISLAAPDTKGWAALRKTSRSTSEGLTADFIFGTSYSADCVFVQKFVVIDSMLFALPGGENSKVCSMSVDGGASWNPLEMPQPGRCLDLVFSQAKGEYYVAAGYGLVKCSPSWDVSALVDGSPTDINSLAHLDLTAAPYMRLVLLAESGAYWMDDTYTFRQGSAASGVAEEKPTGVAMYYAKTSEITLAPWAYLFMGASFGPVFPSKKVAYAITRDHPECRVFVSSDGGETWSVAAQLSKTYYRSLTTIRYCASADRLYVGGKAKTGDLYISTIDSSGLLKDYKLGPGVNDSGEGESNTYGFVEAQRVMPDRLACDPATGIVTCINLPANASTCDVNSQGVPVCDPGYTLSQDQLSCFKSCPAQPLSGYVTCDPLTGVTTCVANNLPDNSSSCDVTTGDFICDATFATDPINKDRCINDCSNTADPRNNSNYVACDADTGLYSCKNLPEYASTCDTNPGGGAGFICDTGFTPSLNYTGCCPTNLPPTVACDPNGVLSCVLSATSFATNCNKDPLSSTFGQLVCKPGYTLNAATNQCIINCAPGFKPQPSNTACEISCPPNYTQNASKQSCCPTTLPSTISCDANGIINCKFTTTTFATNCNKDPLSSTFGQLVCNTGYTLDVATNKCIINCAPGFKPQPSNTACEIVCATGYTQNANKQSCCPTVLPSTVKCDPLTGALSCVLTSTPNAASCVLTDPLAANFGQLVCKPGWQGPQCKCPDPLPDTVLSCDNATGVLSCKTGFSGSKCGCPTPLLPNMASCTDPAAGPLAITCAPYFTPNVKTASNAYTDLCATYKVTPPFDLSTNPDVLLWIDAMQPTIKDYSIKNNALDFLAGTAPPIVPNTWMDKPTIDLTANGIKTATKYTPTTGMSVYMVCVLKPKTLDAYGPLDDDNAVIFNHSSCPVTGSTNTAGIGLQKIARTLNKNKTSPSTTQRLDSRFAMRCQDPNNLACQLALPYDTPILIHYTLSGLTGTFTCYTPLSLNDRGDAINFRNSFDGSSYYGYGAHATTKVQLSGYPGGASDFVSIGWEALGVVPKMRVLLGEFIYSSASYVDFEMIKYLARKWAEPRTPTSFIYRFTNLAALPAFLKSSSLSNLNNPDGNVLNNIILWLDASRYQNLSSGDSMKGKMRDFSHYKAPLLTDSTFSPAGMNGKPCFVHSVNLDPATRAPVRPVVGTQETVGYPNHNITMVHPEFNLPFGRVHNGVFYLFMVCMIPSISVSVPGQPNQRSVMGASVFKHDWNVDSATPQDYENGLSLYINDDGTDRIKAKTMPSTTAQTAGLGLPYDKPIIIMMKTTNYTSTAGVFEWIRTMQIYAPTSNAALGTPLTINQTLQNNLAWVQYPFKMGNIMIGNNNLLNAECNIQFSEVMYMNLALSGSSITNSFDATQEANTLNYLLKKWWCAPGEACVCPTPLPPNVASCNTTTGAFTCLPGWSGSNCLCPSPLLPNMASCSDPFTGPLSITCATDFSPNIKTASNAYTDLCTTFSPQPPFDPATTTQLSLWLDASRPTIKDYSMYNKALNVLGDAAIVPNLFYDKPCIDLSSNTAMLTTVDRYATTLYSCIIMAVVIKSSPAFDQYGPKTANLIPHHFTHNGVRSRVGTNLPYPDGSGIAFFSFAVSSTQQYRTNPPSTQRLDYRMYSTSSNSTGMQDMYGGNLGVPFDVPIFLVFEVKPLNASQVTKTLSVYNPFIYDDNTGKNILLNPAITSSGLAPLPGTMTSPIGIAWADSLTSKSNIHIAELMYFQNSLPTPSYENIVSYMAKKWCTAKTSTSMIYKNYFPYSNINALMLNRDNPTRLRLWLDAARYQNLSTGDSMKNKMRDFSLGMRVMITDSVYESGSNGTGINGKPCFSHMVKLDPVTKVPLKANSAEIAGYPQHNVTMVHPEYIFPVISAMTQIFMVCTIVSSDIAQTSYPNQKSVVGASLFKHDWNKNSSDPTAYDKGIGITLNEGGSNQMKATSFPALPSPGINIPYDTPLLILLTYNYPSAGQRTLKVWAPTSNASLGTMLINDELSLAFTSNDPDVGDLMIGNTNSLIKECNMKFSEFIYLNTIESGTNDILKYLLLKWWN